MNNSYTTARHLLPQMPEEIFSLWFDGRIKANGWPPNGVAWKGALREKSIEYWAKLQWNKCLVKIDYDLLTELSKEIIDSLTEANFHNKPNYYSDYLPNSKSRLDKITKFIKINSKLPNPLIFIYENGKYEIVDGSHRLTAFFQLQKPNNLSRKQEAWIGLV
jgi:hypothetical protein